MAFKIMIDLETINNPDNPAPVPASARPLLGQRRRPRQEPAKASSFPGASHWQIVAFGVAVIDEHHVQKITTIAGSEREMVEKFVRSIKRDDTVLSYNGRGFDLPVVDARCFHYGISWPWYHGGMGFDPKYRYKIDHHYDLMDYLSGFGATRQTSMNAAARAMGLPGKGSVSGANVEVLWAAGEHRLVNLYVCDDVAQQSAIYLRTELLRGTINLSTYQAAIRQWMIVAEAAVPGILDRCDLPTLTLAGEAGGQ